MNKRIITVIAIAGLVAAGLGIYLFISQSNKSNENDKGQAYIEPNPNFFDASQISANDTVIKITDDGFSPSSITVKKGTKVTFANFTNNYAWPASDPHPIHTDDPAFDPQLPMKANQAWSFVFSKVGEWQFHDHLSPSRRGTVKVIE